jgi:hypothetical protein
MTRSGRQFCKQPAVTVFVVVAGSERAFVAKGPAADPPRGKSIAANELAGPALDTSPPLLTRSRTATTVNTLPRVKRPHPSPRGRAQSPSCHIPRTSPHRAWPRYWNATTNAIGADRRLGTSANRTEATGRIKVLRRVDVPFARFPWAPNVVPARRRDDPLHGSRPCNDLPDGFRNSVSSATSTTRAFTSRASRASMNRRVNTSAPAASVSAASLIPGCR